MAKKAYMWDGTTWLEILSNAAPTTYYQTAAPTAPNEGDIWVDSDDEILSATGPQGIQGVAGTNGDKGGVKYAFSTTTTDSDPGNGTFRYNNATIASVTSIFIDNLDAAGNTQTGWYDTWDDSTNAIEGQLTIVGNSDSTVNVFNVTGAVTVASGYYKIPVAYVSGSLPTNTSNYVVSFSRAGNVGATGATGPSGDPTLSVTASGSEKTTNYTFISGDESDLIVFSSASALQAQIPTDATFNFAIGTQINILRKGTGALSVIAVTPATTSVRATPSAALRAQYSLATCIKIAANEWLVVGDLS